MFFDLVIFHKEELKQKSLNDLCITLKKEYGIEITKQSLDERFNNYAVAFLAKALEKLLNQQLAVDVPLTAFKNFKRVLIKDSVCFQIDPSLQKDYPGSGGSGSEAAVRLQFEYDLLTGTIVDLSINAFNDQDATNSKATIRLTEAGDLIIRDLAYMCLDVLKELIEQLAYFVCRLNPNTKIYEKKGDEFIELNFVKIRRYMKERHLHYIEKDVFVGSKHLLPVRLILQTVPEEEMARRIRKAKANNKKKGRGELTAEFKARTAFNLFMTNATPDMLATEHVLHCYRLRWQIELIFKIWKSICKIDKVKKVKKHRFECYVYAKLIFIVLGWQIVWAIARFMYCQKGKALSFFKAFKTLADQLLEDLRDAFVWAKTSAKMFVFDFYNTSIDYHLLEKKKGRLTILERLIIVAN